MNGIYMLRPKPILPVDKVYGSYMTNDGYLVSPMFALPLQTARELNRK